MSYVFRLSNVYEVKNAWRSISIPQYNFMALCLINQDMMLHGMVLI